MSDGATFSNKNDPSSIRCQLAGSLVTGDLARWFRLALSGRQLAAATEARVQALSERHERELASSFASIELRESRTGRSNYSDTTEGRGRHDTATHSAASRVSRDSGRPPRLAAFVTNRMSASADLESTRQPLLGVIGPVGCGV